MRLFCLSPLLLFQRKHKWNCSWLRGPRYLIKQSRSAFMPGKTGTHTHTYIHTPLPLQCAALYNKINLPLRGTTCVMENMRSLSGLCVCEGERERWKECIQDTEYWLINALQKKVPSSNSDITHMMMILTNFINNNWKFIVYLIFVIIFLHAGKFSSNFYLCSFKKYFSSLPLVLLLLQF